ncbi:MAG: DCC1-like thiol-disulfide oxidoreductase family protein [Pseudomonadota bacterium]
MTPKTEHTEPANTYAGDLYVYDGECAMCSRFVHFLVKHDRGNHFALMTAQSALGRAVYRTAKLDPDLMETALLRVNGRLYKNLDVFTETLVALGGVWKTAIILRGVPRPISDWIYRRIANNRKLFQRDTCPIPSPEVRARLIE